MSKEKLRKIKQEVKEKALAKVRWQWFKTYKELRNAAKVCRMYGISRSQFYYWKKRLNLLSSGKGESYSKSQRLQSYPRKPKTNPKSFSPEVIKLIIKIRERTNRGAVKNYAFQGLMCDLTSQRQLPKKTLSAKLSPFI